MLFLKLTEKLGFLLKLGLSRDMVLRQNTNKPHIPGGNEIKQVKKYLYTQLPNNIHVQLYQGGTSVVLLFGRVFATRQAQILQ